VTASVAVSTIGFTRTSAEDFFDRLLKSKARRVIDVRLNNTSQLAGFAKVGDLPFFLKAIGNIDYVHEPLLAPTDAMLRAYKKEKGDWPIYEHQFLDLMKSREIEKRLSPKMLEGACLLCSEATPHHCHRRLVCEYLNDRWDGLLAVSHL
jgi:uncharacterized protein (DUF488 family)